MTVPSPLPTPENDRPTPGARGPLPGGKWFVPLKEACGLLPVSERAMRALIVDDEVPYRRVQSRLYLLWPDDFDTFVTSSLIA